MNTKATILTLVSVLALCGVGLADELYVPGQYATIQAAIDAAVDGDEVIVADGTYTGQGVSNNGIHFIDFRGKAITVKSQNGPENCVIDFTSAILDCGFMFYRQEGRDSVLDGLTLRGGYGAVNCADNSNPTIQNCVITGKTTEYGGGINCYDSSPLIINCTIRGNRAKERSGGGIHCRGQSSPVIENCTISKNAAPRGGGIYCNNEGFEDTGPLIINCTVTDNTAEYEDGGICTEYSSATIVNCIVSDNTGGHGGIGGIVCRSGGRTTISNSIISNNEGGGILCINSSVQISNCTITENLLGGVTCTDGDVTIANCMISGNIGSVSCARSGCIISNCELTGNRVRWDYGVVNCLYESEIMIRNCTIADNKAHRAGVIRDAGIRCSDGGSLTVTNSVLWSGSIENVGQGTYVTVTYSDIEGGYPGQGNIDVDPCFAFAGDYHLAPDSPCIDTGDTNYVPEPNEADLDGKVRISGSTIDMGAYEFGHEGALIAVSKKVVELFVREGQAHSSEEIIGIRNCGGAELRWKIVEDCRWLSVRPKMGSNLGEIDEVAFRASGTRLEHGDYTCMAEVVDRQALYSPRQVAVTLHVNRTQLVPEQYGTIQAAIDDSVNGDLVIVADGTYTGEGNRDIDFLGKAITVQSESGPDNCIIDCNGSEAEPHRGFYFLNVEDGNSILDGFTITNGYAATYVWYGSGGAICCYGSSPTIRNCVIANSSAARGGGVSCIGGRPTLTGCTISANKGRYSGGGVSMHGGRLVIANCLITGNIAEREAGGIRLSDASAVVSNCTIAENSAGKRGGAVYCNESDPAITDCTMSGNTAEYGGALSWSRSNATITNCVISSNTAERDGGGIECIDDSTAAVIDCTITANTASSRGGGIYGDVGNLTITNCVINSNAGYAGGGICYGLTHCGLVGSFMITDCTIEDNTAEYGAGVHFYRSSDAEVINCVITGNSARDVGGGISSFETSPTIVGCVISRNQSAGRAGGIFCGSYTSPVIANSTISANTSCEGGGIYSNPGSTPTIVDCLITGNSASLARSCRARGGGIHCRDSSPAISNCTVIGNYAQVAGGIYSMGGSVTIASSILWYNFPEEVVYDGSVLVAYSDILGNWSGVGNIDADPCFIELGYWDVNGVWVEGDYRLLEGSPCIDSGDPNYAGGPNETDLDGKARVIDGDEDGAAVVDMGAYEYIAPLEAEMKLTPRTVNCRSRGKSIKAHITLPEGFSAEDVDVDEPAVAEPMDIESKYIKVIGNGEGPVRLEVGFERGAFCEAVSHGGEVEVTVAGWLTSGREFYGTDTIRIKTATKEQGKGQRVQKLGTGLRVGDTRRGTVNGCVREKH